MKSENTRTQKAGILIADENFLFRKGLRTLIAREPDFEVAGEADCETGLLSALESRPAEILIVSAAILTGGSELAASLRNHYPRVQVVVLTPDTISGPVDGTADDSDVSFADSAMPRGQAPSMLLKELRRLLLPETSADEQTADLRALALNHQAARPNLLTGREKEVVRLLSDGLTVREAAGELGLSCKTVEAHTLNLMRKLDIHDRSSLIEYAVTAGMA